MILRCQNPECRFIFGRKTKEPCPYCHSKAKVMKINTKSREEVAK